MAYSKGFTLVELIASLVLASIIGTIGSIGVSSFSKYYMISIENSQVAGSAQLALLRIAKEILVINSVSSSSATSISFRSQHDAATERNFTLALNGDNLELTDAAAGTTDILISNVAGFNLEYYNWNFDLPDPLVPSSSWVNWPSAQFPLALDIEKAEYDSGTDELDIHFKDVVNGNSRDFRLTYAGSDNDCAWVVDKYECVVDTTVCYNTVHIWATSDSGGGGTHSLIEVPLNPLCTVEGPDPQANNAAPPLTGSGGTKLIKVTLALTGSNTPFTIMAGPRNIN